MKYMYIYYISRENILNTLLIKNLKSLFQLWVYIKTFVNLTLVLLFFTLVYYYYLDFYIYTCICKWIYIITADISYKFSKVFRIQYLWKIIRLIIYRVHFYIVIQIIEDQYSQNTYSGQILGNIESFRWKQSGINYHKLKEIQ